MTMFHPYQNQKIDQIKILKLEKTAIKLDKNFMTQQSLKIVLLTSYGRTNIT